MQLSCAATSRHQMMLPIGLCLCLQALDLGRLLSRTADLLLFYSYTHLVVATPPVRALQMEHD